MPTRTLPASPSLDHLRQQARALQRGARAGDPDALARANTHPNAGLDPAQFPLSAAQLVLAREYGFASWTRLKSYVALVDEYGWVPPEEPVATVADEFCRLALLSYTPRDAPDRWQSAKALLDRHPDLVQTSIWAAATAGHAKVVAAMLATDPSLVTRRGGPYGWRPLCYVTYSRVDGLDPVGTARILLAAGADPNEGYLWHGQPTPFTVLTGVFGEGEMGPVRQPKHPQWMELARLLLDAGADPNDGQALYNRMFTQVNEHLELLFSYGLGRGDGGPWKARLGDQLDAPAGLLRYQLRWAIDHDMLDRVRLLAEHGTALSPQDLERARLTGNTAIADYLVARGVPSGPADAVAELIAAAFRGDRASVRRLARPDVLDAARRQRPGLVVWATSRGRADTVAILVELGFDVNARGRGDSPVEEEWETALHQAVAVGDPDLVRLLLSLGADPALRDVRFDATPLDWAQHLHRPQLVPLLTDSPAG